MSTDFSCNGQGTGTNLDLYIRSFEDSLRSGGTPGARSRPTACLSVALRSWYERGASAPSS